MIGHKEFGLFGKQASTKLCAYWDLFLGWKMLPFFSLDVVSRQKTKHFIVKGACEPDTGHVLFLLGHGFILCG